MFKEMCIHTETYLQENNCPTESVAICVMDVRGSTPTFVTPSHDALESARNVEDIFHTLLKGHIVSFLQYEVIKCIILSFCSECADLLQELRNYEMCFKEHTVKNKVCIAHHIWCVQHVSIRTPYLVCYAHLPLAHHFGCA